MPLKLNPDDERLLAMGMRITLLIFFRRRERPVPGGGFVKVQFCYAPLQSSPLVRPYPKIQILGKPVFPKTPFKGCPTFEDQRILQNRVA